jgi:hypothetical protein
MVFKALRTIDRFLPVGALMNRRVNDQTNPKRGLAQNGLTGLGLLQVRL